MTRLACLIAACGLLLSSAAAHAQVVTYQPVTTYYAPVGPTTYTVASPVVAPTAYTVASPVVTTAPAARVSYYAPVAPAPVATTCCAPVVAPAPAATVTYYRAPQVSYQPTAQVVTRHRPILGGTVSRVQYGYTPVVY